MSENTIDGKPVIRWKKRVRNLRAPLILILFISLMGITGSGCTDQEEEAEVKIFDLNLPIYFRGTINETLTVSCGSASAGTTTSSSTTTTTETDTGSTSSYVITSYYTFVNDMIGQNTGEIISMKYTYYPDRDSYSLTPLTTIIQECDTNDGINCLSGGTLRCRTVDNIRCGGEEYFTYYNPLANYSFLADSGTINWSKGFNLSDDSTSVQNVELDLTFIDSTGKLFQGEVTCISNN